MPYITNSNANSIITKIEINSLDLKGEIYKINIDFFNKFETNLLRATKYFFENPDEFYKKKYIKYIKQPDTYNFVYEYDGAGPAYHSKNDCPKLLSDYKNFRIPEQIKKRGSEEVLRYRKWFKERESLLITDPGKFLEFLAVSWGVQSTESTLKLLKQLYQNSGVVEIENTNLDTIEKNIDNLICEANNKINESDKNITIFNKYMHSTFKWSKRDPLFIENTNYPDKEIREILRIFEQKFKQPLMKKLKDYYRIKFNPNLEFKGELLDQLGFGQCMTCYSLPFDINDFNIKEIFKDKN